MILKSKVKEILAIWVAALAYLQIARCGVSKDDIQEIDEYWTNRIDSIRREVELRSVVLRELGSRPKGLTFNKNMFKMIREELKKGKNVISEIRRPIEHFNECAEQMKSILCELTELSVEIENKGCSSKSEEIQKYKTLFEGKKAELDKLLYPLFNNSTVLVNQIQKADSYIINVLEGYSTLSNKEIKLHDLALFKLAKNRKIIAASIIYFLYSIDPSIQSADLEDKLGFMSKVILGHIPRENAELFTNAIRKDVEKNKIAPLLAADRQLHLLFYTNESKFVVDDGIVNVYINLIKPDVSVEELKQRKNITPVQVVRVIMIEYLMSGYLLDHRMNRAFFSLGRVIESMFKLETGDNVSYIIVLARLKQDIMLNAISLMWCDRDTLIDEMYNDFERFCSKNYLPLGTLKKVQDAFKHSKWLYKLDRYNPMKCFPADEDKLETGMHFDVSYVHPLWHICRRCEELSQVVAPLSAPNKTPFMEIHDAYILRPYLISKDDNDSTVRSTNMRDCIDLWFKTCADATIIYRKEDSLEYYNLAKDFDNYLRMSQRLHFIEMKVKKTEKEELPQSEEMKSTESSENNSLQDSQSESKEAKTSESSESNPLQDMPSESEEDDFVMVQLEDAQ
ncbi:hypothetical protein NEMIN01_2437 [Nematocida minor]|uniref:uncharacterized protein n=1 Tax=Nematocida minor TaxID=1912983 RepID=UPI00221FE3C4|nr:uncharacterized protein NEMIN01_2437 [Nematocida minor]KAI5193243.1 hypothetical protein NEMIN01_2437 [Nematocida minor]